MRSEHIHALDSGREVLVCASSKAANVLKALPALISSESKTEPEDRLASSTWTLQHEPGDALLRFFSFTDIEKRDDFVLAIDKICQEMDHHAELVKGEFSTPDVIVFTVLYRVRTHQPPGISMRDIKLCRSVDKLADQPNVKATEQIRDASIVTQNWLDNARTHAIEALEKGEYDCGCEVPGKAS